MDTSSLRKEYTSAGLDKADVDPDPLVQFHEWFEKVIEADLHEPNAMILATATAGGKPSARTVLLKGYDERGFVFYSNYEGRKAKEIDANPTCALLFYWGELERQVRITGGVVRTSREESEAYYRTRPLGSRIGAWVSHQSQVIAGRAVLEQGVREAEVRFAGGEVPLPDHWGGFRVVPDGFEFWQGRPSRLHDRIVYVPKGGGGWRVERLSP